MDTQISDVLIIGGGPIGLACGIAAQKKGLNYVIVEKGCLTNSLYHYPVNMTFFSTSEKLEIGNVPFISHNNKPTRNEALEYFRRVQSTWGLKVNLYEKVLEVIPSSNSSETGDVIYQVKTTKATYWTYSIVVATGFFDFPHLMNIEGEDLPKVKHYYDDPHLYIGQDVVVVGAANSAIDAALETYRKGANVTLVIREENISERIKYWIRPDIENRIKEGAIKAYFLSQITEIRAHEVEINTPSGAVTLKNDWVLAMTGYQPDFDFLTSMGVEIAEDEIRKPTYNPDTYESNVPHIFLAGVVCGGMKTNTWFIENSRFHADVIMEEISKRKPKQDTPQTINDSKLSFKEKWREIKNIFNK